MSPLVQFSLFLIISHQSSLIHSIKYTLTKSTSETTHHDEDVITSEENVRKLTVEDEFHIFDKDLLQITEKTAIFIMNRNYVLHKIESGAFADQDITETILISNSNLKVLQTGTFKNLKIFELILSDNEITDIEDEAIDNLPNLRILNLSKNRIVQFSAECVIDAPASYLDMAFNHLQEVGENWFRFMTDEEPATVLLDNNEIESVDSMAFEGVLLGTLNLRSNRIGTLPFEMFEDDTISRVYLQDNSLETLPETFFELSQLSLANLNGNPLDCDTQEKLKKKKSRQIQIIYDEDC
jgi:hypothetical protein